jgi:hypothetical protein
LEIKKFYSEDAGKEINALYLNDEAFDYLIDEESLLKAKTYCDQGPNYRKSVYGDILRHFLGSFSTFIGRPVGLKELLQAIKDGEIEMGTPASLEEIRQQQKVATIGWKD